MGGKVRTECGGVEGVRKARFGARLLLLLATQRLFLLAVPFLSLICSLATLNLF